MMQFGDVALLYTKEDISKYMKIRKIAPEKSITNIKANTPIHMYHYGLPTGKFKNDPMGTMYHSKEIFPYGSQHQSNGLLSNDG